MCPTLATACAVGETALSDRGPLAIPVAGYSAVTAGAASGPAAGFMAPPPPPPVAGISVPVAGSGGVGVMPVAGISAIAGTSGGTGSVAGAAGTSTPVTPMDLTPFDAGNDSNRNMVQPGGLCARLAIIQCAGEAHCCSTRTRSVEACRATLNMKCTQELYLDQIAMNPITNFDPSAAYSGFTQLEQKASQCDIGVLAWAGSETGLRGILKGTLAPGASCKPAANITDPPTAGAALASCTSSATTACLPKSVLGDWTCAPRNSSGGSCVTDANCVVGTYCHNPTKAPLGKCAQLIALGGACTEGGQCSSLFCNNGQCVAADQQLAYCGE